MVFRSENIRLLTSFFIALSMTAVLWWLTDTFMAFDSTSSAIADAVAREILSGGTVGRQALVGSCWFAPLPSLAVVPFARIFHETPFGVKYAVATAAHFALFLFLMMFTFRMLNTRNEKTSLFTRFVDVAALFTVYSTLQIFPLCIGKLDIYILYPVLLLVAAAVKFTDWLRTHSVRDWVKYAFFLALLPLCGIRAFFPTVTLVTLSLAAVVISNRERPRFQGMAFLAITPFFYSIGVWTLMAFLVLGDGTYPLHGIKEVHTYGFCTTFTTPELQDTQSPLPIADTIRARTKYGRVFVCGYQGLALIGKLPNKDRTIFEPCIDLHIGMIRKNYPKQDLFLLVPKPIGSAVLDSVTWRYDDLYQNATQRLLFAEDFGNWRLYEIINAGTDRIAEDREMFQGDLNFINGKKEKCPLRHTQL